MSLKLKSQSFISQRKERNNPFKDNPENLKEAIRLVKLGHSTRQIAPLFDVTHKTVYKYVKNYLKRNNTCPQPIGYIPEPVIPQVVELKQPPKEVIKYKDTKTHYFNEIGEKIYKGHDYAWYLKKAKLKKPVDNY